MELDVPYDTFLPSGIVDGACSNRFVRWLWLKLIYNSESQTPRFLVYPAGAAYHHDFPSPMLSFYFRDNLCPPLTRHLRTQNNGSATIPDDTVSPSRVS